MDTSSWASRNLDCVSLILSSFLDLTLFICVSSGNVHLMFLVQQWECHNCSPGSFHRWKLPQTFQQALHLNVYKFAIITVESANFALIFFLALNFPFIWLYKDLRVVSLFNNRLYYSVICNLLKMLKILCVFNLWGSFFKLKYIQFSMKRGPKSNDIQISREATEWWYHFCIQCKT